MKSASTVARSGILVPGDDRWRGEFHPEFGPLREDVLFRIKTLVAEQLLAGRVEENLGGNQLDAVARTFLAFLPDIDEHDLELAGILLFQLGKDGGHHFAGNAFVGAQIDEPRK